MKMNIIEVIDLTGKPTGFHFAVCPKCGRRDLAFPNRELFKETGWTCLCDEPHHPHNIIAHADDGQPIYAKTLKYVVADDLMGRA